jgi:glucosylceramidase
MKDNGRMVKGGSLLPAHAGTWASYTVKFVQAYEREGIPIWGLTVQNEPLAVQSWESMIVSAEQERDFVRDHLGKRTDAPQCRCHPRSLARNPLAVDRSHG